MFSKTLVYEYNLLLTSNGILYPYTDIVLFLYLCAKSQNKTFPALPNPVCFSLGYSIQQTVDARLAETVLKKISKVVLNYLLVRL